MSFAYMWYFGSLLVFVQSEEHCEIIDISNTTLYSCLLSSCCVIDYYRTKRQDKHRRYTKTCRWNWSWAPASSRACTTATSYVIACIALHCTVSAFGQLVRVCSQLLNSVVSQCLCNTAVKFTGNFRLGITIGLKIFILGEVLIIIDYIFPLVMVVLYSGFIALTILLFIALFGIEILCMIMNSMHWYWMLTAQDHVTRWIVDQNYRKEQEKLKIPFGRLQQLATVFFVSLCCLPWLKHL